MFILAVFHFHIFSFWPGVNQRIFANNFGKKIMTFLLFIVLFFIAGIFFIIRRWFSLLAITFCNVPGSMSIPFALNYHVLNPAIFFWHRRSSNIWKAVWIHSKLSKFCLFKKVVQFPITDVFILAVFYFAFFNFCPGI